MLDWVAGISVGFVLMEPFSWAIHKYLMHGPLWRIHQTHHIHKGKSFWEANDLFSLFFAACSAVLIYYGLSNKNTFVAGGGFGIALYGLMFFVFHDLFIHRRIKGLGKPTFKGFWGKIVRAHLEHHKSTRDPKAKYFGLLYIRDKKNS